METKPTPIRCDHPDCRCARDDEVKWLALLLRQGLKLVVVGIERRYGIEDKSGASRNGLTIH